MTLKEWMQKHNLDTEEQLVQMLQEWEVMTTAIIQTDVPQTFPLWEKEVELVMGACYEYASLPGTHRESKKILSTLADELGYFLEEGDLSDPERRKYSRNYPNKE